MRDGGGDHLRKGGAHRAAQFGGRIHLRMLRVAHGRRKMTELVTHSTLLCHDQQQQEAQGV
jgi:hypothetical protein